MTLGSGVCTAKALQQALTRARSGDTVTVGVCKIDGSFTVPAGVALAGQDPKQSIIHGPTGKPTLKLLPGATSTKSPTAVKTITLLSDGQAGITASGEGMIDVENVTVTSSTGIGIGIEGGATLTASAVTLTGPITQANAGTYPAAVDPKKVATIGLVILDGKNHKLNDVTASGFADYGVLLVNTITTWTGGGSKGNLGTGLMAVGGDVTLEGVPLSGNFKGARKISGFGAVFTDRVAGVVVSPLKVTSTNAYVGNNEGIGLLHDGASVQASHKGLQAESNGAPAVWAQGSTKGITLDTPKLTKNTFAGFVGMNLDGVIIHGATIDGTKSATLPLGPSGNMITLGDGVHLFASKNVTIDQASTLNDSERVGLVLDLENALPADSGLKWELTVTTSAKGAAALCQAIENKQLKLWPVGDPTGWDAGITRAGVNATLDSAILSPMAMSAAIGPEIIPAPPFKGGLSGLSP